jgi:DNA-binding PadR family transcriptional regulator
MARRGDTIELAVLGLLHEGPMHGYELRKRLNLMLGWGRVLSYGSLYPALKKMLRANLITEVAAPATASTRRPRITYEVTPAGNEHFQRLMTEVGPTAWEDAARGCRSGSRACRESSSAPRPRSTATPPSSSATGWSRWSARCGGSRT